MSGGMEASEVLACQFSRWYPAYRHLTYRSIVMDLPQAFVDYLLEDGIYVPSGSEAVSPGNTYQLTRSRSQSATYSYL